MVMDIRRYVIEYSDTCKLYVIPWRLCCCDEFGRERTNDVDEKVRDKQNETSRSCEMLRAEGIIERNLSPEPWRAAACSCTSFLSYAVMSVAKLITVSGVYSEYCTGMDCCENLVTFVYYCTMFVQYCIYFNTRNRDSLFFTTASHQL